MKTKGSWQGLLQFEEGQPVKIRVGTFNINSILHFLNGKRITLVIEMMPDNQDHLDSGQLMTSGKLVYDEKKKKFLLENYPLVEVLESFKDQKVKFHIELDQSVLSARMT
ncbi:hypothetical protein GCM10010965_30680 [Caldalkalibacillus thermarum]|uniref:hypothetical protein n=1 Tax=Caldalkalibacillus thermarum TaxID=296745 RepID=UPI00166616B8|nr:hypothetical protein [Caldalkalibacillus thermarum]GGK35564.1 hypothetical protein GCM10010965_30680 [Caldalkalibacillus thermarum]